MICPNCRQAMVQVRPGEWRCVSDWCGTLVKREPSLRAFAEHEQGEDVNGCC